MHSLSSVVAIKMIGIHQARLLWAGVWIISLVVILYQYLRSPPNLVILGVKEGGEWHIHMSPPPLKDLLM